GAVLSSFGIVYNRDVLKLLGLEAPTTWSDLADARYDGHVALADPSHSGSIRVTYDAILQRYGWQRGVRTLRRVFANARYFAPGASTVPVDVTSGEAAAGMCIDFYGRFQAQTVGPGRVARGARAGYVAPNGATVVTADPIGMVRGAPSPGLARRFVEFVLSRQGQALWNFGVGAEAVAPDGTVLRGPERFALRRSPIRRDIYAHFREHMADPVNPYAIARPLPEGTPSYFTVLPDLLHAMCMDVHAELNAAWRAIGRTEDPERRRAMRRAFDAMPFTAEQLLESGGGDDERRRWTAFFRAKYRAVVQMAGDSPSTIGG
ncbi:MAG: extracellular solute-binding protein, partial [Alphaproteobacteria bacterium]|nr:extracellular solute-binding protein [Alphaproteobacteria bacterium]